MAPAWPAIVLALALLAGAGDAVAQAKPGAPRGTAGRPCAKVVNSTAYMYPVDVRADGEQLARIAVKAGETREVCLGKPGDDGRIEVIVRSVMAPIGSCKLAFGGAAEIVRAAGADGKEVTRVVCR
jgi:hypothetical protein